MVQRELDQGIVAGTGGDGHANRLMTRRPAPCQGVTGEPCPADETSTAKGDALLLYVYRKSSRIPCGSLHEGTASKAVARRCLLDPDIPSNRELGTNVVDKHAHRRRTFPRKHDAASNNTGDWEARVYGPSVVSGNYCTIKRTILNEAPILH